MTPSTLDVIRLALVHDIHRHQKALDGLTGKTNATEKAGEDHRNAISDLQAAVADLDLEDHRVEAVGALLAMLVTWTDDAPQGHTYREVGVFAAVLAAYGRSTSAAVLLQSHAAGTAELTRSA